MRVEIRTQKSVPFVTATNERRTNTALNVMLIGNGQEVTVATFMWPGSFVDGYLSETQAKVRARETADRLKLFLSAQGSLEEDSLPAKRVGSKRSQDSAFVEPRSFARVG